ncbi:MAG: A/G-specific adenine glycosylase [Candidatus Neomarinimicrobiota bacterium]|jgi:A/G-specific adenine glycosylase
MIEYISQEMTNALMAWFELHRRKMPWRGSHDPYHIWVSEMMLQQTQVATVENYFLRWIKLFPDVFVLAEAELEDVLKAWEGLGYYTRARNFHKGAKYIVENATSQKDPFPKDYDSWLKVPGVGPYTAAAVASIAFAYPAAVVDGNVKRVMSRLFCMDEDVATQKYHKRLYAIMNKAFYDYHPGWVNQAWMELGALQCTPNPDCSICPLINDCQAYAKGTISKYPLRSKRKKIPTRYGAAFIIENDNKTLVLRRPSEGFLGGLWEYPSFTLKEENPEYLGSFCKKHDIDIVQELPQKVKHTYSHFHQELTLYKAKLSPGSLFGAWPEMRKVNSSEMEDLPRSKVTIKISEIIALAKDKKNS